MRQLFFLLTWAFLLSFQSDSPKMILQINGISTLEGNLMIALFDKSESFPDSEKGFKRLVLPVTKSTMKIDLLPFLDNHQYFSIAVYHDKNSNQKLDKNFLGMPVEKYGFSNDARATFGPPLFKEALIKKDVGGKVEITIK